MPKQQRKGDWKKMDEKKTNRMGCEKCREEKDIKNRWNRKIKKVRAWQYEMYMGYWNTEKMNCLYYLYKFKQAFSHD